MPVRVRCPQCQKVVNAPDAARGKAVKCPECESRIPVPAAESTASDSEKSPRPSKPAAKPTGSKTASKGTPARKKGPESDDFLAKLDLSRSEDRNARICPKCGAEVDEEDVECAACGIDLQTGQLGKTARKARMKWADPNDFYKVAWKDAADFVKVNFNLVMKNFANTVLLLFISGVTGAIAQFALQNEHIPSAAFFAVMSIVSSVGVMGWYLYLASKVIMFTLDKKIELDRTNFEMFSAMATGISWVIWFVVASIPFMVIVAPIAFVTKDMGPLVGPLVPGLLLYFLVLFPVPVVMAHRAMPVNWMIWVSPLMWKITLKTFGGVFYTWLIAFVTSLPIILVSIVQLFVVRAFAVGMILAFGGKADALVNQTSTLGIPFEQSTLSVVAASFALVLILALSLLHTFLYSLWATYMLRVVGQFTYYNKRNLELVSQVKEKKYVVKKPKDEDAEGKGSAGAKWAGGIIGVILLYVVVNVVLYFSTGYLLLPKPLAVLLKLANP